MPVCSNPSLIDVEGTAAGEGIGLGASLMIGVTRVPLAEITRELSARHAVPVTVREWSSHELASGYTAPRIVRFDVRYTLSDGSQFADSFVQKTVGKAERTAARLLAPLASEYALPKLCGEGEDDLGAWILMPFLRGKELEDFWLPADVSRSLARVHVHFRGELLADVDMLRVNAEFWYAELDRLEGALERSSAPSDLQEGLAFLREAQVPAAAAALPSTLLHGDVHPGNIIHCDSDDRYVLLDWGNARVGPAGIDLANCIHSPDLASWRRYWDLVEALSGSRVGEEERALQFCVGRAFVSVQYLPFALGHARLERATKMMRDALEACTRLSSD